MRNTTIFINNSHKLCLSQLIAFDVQHSLFCKSVINMFIVSCRSADQVTNGDSVLVKTNGQLIPEEVINVSNIRMQGKCSLTKDIVL